MTDRQLFRVGLRLFGVWLVGTGVASLGFGLIALLMNLTSPLSGATALSVGNQISRVETARGIDGVVSLATGLILIWAANWITLIVHRKDA